MLGFPSEPKKTTRRPGSLAPRLENLEDRTVPALFANPDTYSAEIGRVLTVAAPQGVIANDFSDTFPGQVISAQVVVTAKYVGNPQPLPANSLFLNPDGSFTFIAPSVVPLGVTQVQFTYQAANGSDPNANAVVTLNLTSTPTRFVATGADAGGGPHVKVFEAGSSVIRHNFFPYEATFTGGVRVATGDVNGDAIDDILTIPGDGGGPRLRVFSGKDGAPLVDTFTFDPAYRGGGYVAVGDFDGNGFEDIIVSAGAGGGPRVQVFSLFNPALGKIDPNNNLSNVADFFAYDPASRFGVRVAAGPLQGTAVTRDFIVTSMGPGGTPEVRVFDSQQVIGKSTIVAVSALSFMAVDGSNLDGVFVSTGNLRGDGRHDIITGNGSGPGIVRVFDGRNAGFVRELRVPVDETPTGGGIPSGPANFIFQTPANGALLAPSLNPNTLVPIAPGVGIDPLTTVVRGGARVAAIDWNNDGLDDIVTANGADNTPRVRVFNTANGLEITNILAYSGTFLGGVNIAAS